MSSEIRNPYLRQSLYELAVKRGSGELTPDEETLFQWVRFCTLKKYRYLYEYREIDNPLLERKDDEAMCSGENPHAVCRILGIQTERYLSWVSENFELYPESDAKLLHGNMQMNGSMQKYGNMQMNGSMQKYGNMQMNGSMQKHGNMQINGNVQINENEQIIGKTQAAVKQTDAGIYENLIHRDFNPLKSGEKFSIGIGIYNTKSDGPLYLAGIIDMYDKSAAGIVLGGYRSSELAGAAMDTILESKKVREMVPVLHSSQNPIYRSKAYHREVECRAVIPSMTSKGERGGNAVISTFFSQIKRRMKGYQFENWQDAVDWLENDLLLHRVAGVR